MAAPKENILQNVFICSGGNNLELCDIYFDSKIRKIAYKASRSFKWEEIKDKKQKDNIVSEIKNNDNPGSAEITDGNFMFAMPGAVDPHVHFDTPGFEFRETFEDASLAAAFGGVTTIIDMPCTSLPPVTTLENFKTKLEAVKNRSHIDFSFWGGIAGNNFDEKQIEINIRELSNAGAAGFKAYLISGMDTFTDLSFNQMKIAAKFTNQYNKPLAVHAEDKKIIEANLLKLNGSGTDTWQDYCNARSIEAEVKAVNDMIRIASLTDAKIHIVHLSSAQGLADIIKAHNAGLHITTETCPHYLFFTQEDFKNNSIRNYLKTAPPVKFEKDKEALWKGLADGSVSFVTTDHAGCDPKVEKSSNDFSKVYGGIPGVEHRVPFLLSEGFLKHKLTLEKAIDHLSKNSASYFGLYAKGRIATGYDADFALIDLWSSEEISHSKMHSKGKYTPFEGRIFNAVVVKTMLRGNLIMDKLPSSEKSSTDFEKQFHGKFIHA